MLSTLTLADLIDYPKKVEGSDSMVFDEPDNQQKMIKVRYHLPLAPGQHNSLLGPVEGMTVKEKDVFYMGIRKHNDDEYFLVLHNEEHKFIHQSPIPNQISEGITSYDHPSVRAVLREFNAKFSKHLKCIKIKLDLNSFLV